MNAKQGAFVSILVVGSTLGFAWIMSLIQLFSFAESLLVVLAGIGAAGLLIVCVNGVLTIFNALSTIYDALNDQ